MLDHPPSCRFVDRAGPECQSSDLASLLVARGASVFHQPEHPSQKIQIEVGVDLVVFVGDLGGVQIREIGSAQQLGAHHRPSGGADDAINEGGHVDAGIAKPQQDTGFPGDAGDSTPGQDERRGHD